MALFEVPGWSVPMAPVSGSSAGTNSRKRKRHEPGEDEAKIQSAAVNVERLFAKLGDMSGGGDVRERQIKQKKTKGKETEETLERNAGSVGKRQRGREIQEKRRNQSAKKDEKQERREGKGKGKRDDTRLIFSSATSKSPEKHGKKRKGGDVKAEHTVARAEDKTVDKEISRPQKNKKGQDAAGEGGLTALQAKMKQSLDGARFRWINETLYKSDSAHAHEMMRENRSVFVEYHTGFRHQVQSWPVNPVAHYVSTLSSYPPRTVIADLGCGDAALARALAPKGLTVLSYDLVSDGAFVIEADTCSKIPLPGSEDENNEDGGAAQVVDVVVCALSLMSVNWVGCIKEAWRILKLGRELKIAEVASRFTDVDGFTSLVSSAGFKLRSKDDSNSHFTLFEFFKVSRKPQSDEEWAKLMARGEVLKPCEYKRR